MKRIRIIYTIGASLIFAGLVCSHVDAAIQNPYHTVADWRVWYDNQSPISIDGDTLNPVDESLRYYPVDPTTAEAAAGLYMKFVSSDYLGRRYAGLFNDAYDTADDWHTNIPWEMVFNGGNRVTVSGQQGGANQVSLPRYLQGDYYSHGSKPSFGIQLSNQSTTLMGDYQVKNLALNLEEDWYFKNMVRAGNSFTSFQTGAFPKDYYPALLPVLFNGDGASYDQMAGYGKMFYAGAWLPLETKRDLLRNGLYASTVLYNWKSSLPYNVPYDHMLRHRPSYAVNGIDRDGINVPHAFEYMGIFDNHFDANLHMENMVAQYKQMNATAPVSLIKAVEIIQGSYNSQVNQAANLKTLVALEHPASGDRSVIVRVSTEDCFDLNELPLTVRAKVLYGNKDTQVEHESEHVWKITVPWDDTLPEGRTDLIFVANNGLYDSNPAVVSVMRPFGVNGYADEYDSVRTPTRLPQITRVLPGESAEFDLYSEDEEELPISFYLHEGADGTLDGNRYVQETTAATSEGESQIVVTAANERTGNSLNGTKGRVRVQNTIAELAADELRGNAPFTVQFTAAASRDRDTNTLSYAWDFNDGSTAGNVSATNHTFTTPGIYQVRVVATGPLGSDTNTVLVQVEANTWGLALNRGWTTVLDPAVWTGAGGAYSIKAADANNSSGNIQITSQITSTADFSLPLVIEADFNYDSNNRKQSYFDFFGHRLGMLLGSGTQTLPPTNAEDWVDGPLATQSELAFEANYQNAGTIWGEHIGAIRATGELYVSLRLNLRDDPNHAGKMLIVGEVETEVGIYPVYFDNLDKLNNKLQLVSANGAFKLPRYQVWTPAGSLSHSDILVLDENGDRLWDNHWKWGFPSYLALMPSGQFDLPTSVNGSVSKTYTILNRGSATLNIGSLSIPASQKFDITVPPAIINLAPGATTTFEVTFNPTAAGSVRGDLSIVSDSFQAGGYHAELRGRNAMAKEIHVEGNGLNLASGDTTPNETDHTTLGSVVVGEGITRDFLVRNLGTLPLAMGTATLSGSSHFTIVKQPRSSVQDFGSTLVSVRYEPASAGSHTATLTIPSDDADEPAYTLALAGDSTAFVDSNIIVLHDGSTVASASTLNLGAYALSTESYYEILVVSNQTGLLNLGELSISGADTNFFFATRLPPSKIPAGFSFPLEIQFTPDSVRAYSAVLTIPSDDPDTPAYTLTLNATGSSSPALKLSGNGIDIFNGDTDPLEQDGTDFGIISSASGSFVDQLFTLRNPALASTLSISSMTFSDDAAADFQILAPVPASVAAGASVDFTVRLTPSAPGIRSATLSVVSDAPDSPFTVAMVGRRNGWPKIDLSGTVEPPAHLTGNYVIRLSTDWIDYDQDGDLDLFRIGEGDEGTNRVAMARCYRNDAGILVEDTNAVASITSFVSAPRTAWHDYDNDGDLDLSIGAENEYSAVYRNDAGVFAFDGLILGSGEGSSAKMAWGDLDNDGDQDVAVDGFSTASGGLIQLENNGGSLSGISSDIGGVVSFDRGFMEWFDADGDGDEDLAVQGYWLDEGYPFALRIFENQSGVVSTNNVLLEILGQRAVAVADLDGDGAPELVTMAGTGGASNTDTVEIFWNSAGVFSVEDTYIPSLSSFGAVACGDLDNDGDVDIAIAGKDGAGLFYVRVIENQGDGFSPDPNMEEQVTSLVGTLNLVDIDNDGDLDIFATGSEIIQRIGEVFLFENQAPTANSAPSKILGLTHGTNTGSVVFSWFAGSDDTTPSSGLSYNLRVGLAGNTNAIASGMAADSGVRYWVGAGRVQGTNHTLNLPSGTYVAQVQAIDASYTGGAWSDPIAVVVGAGGYEAWSAGMIWGGADSSSTGNGDGDTLDNYWEYAMDTDPLAFNAAPISTAVDSAGSFFLFNFRRNKQATELAWQLQSATNLISAWLERPVDQTDVWLESVDADPDGDGTAELMRYKVRIEAEDQVDFYRLDIE